MTRRFVHRGHAAGPYRDRCVEQRPLNERQRRFVAAFVACGNASEATRRAGYKSKASVQGALLLANPSIAAAIREMGARAAQRVELDQDWLLERLTAEATFGLDADLDTRLRAAPARISALDKICRCLVLYVTRAVIEAKVDVQSQAAGARQKLTAMLLARAERTAPDSALPTAARSTSPHALGTPAK